MVWHSLLKRQLRRHLVAVEDLPHLYPHLLPLLESVNAAYSQHDVDRQMLEHALNLSSQEIEQAAQDRARATAAEEANRAKSRFLANMSHELRTPLNAIIGYTEMLLEDEECQPFQADLERIRSAGRHQLAMVNDILDLAKIEAGRMELHLSLCDAGQIARDAIGTVAPLAAAGGNQLHLVAPLPGETVLTSDPFKLRQCLLNLLGNACKFTKNGTVLLHVETRPAALHITVSDTGIGMTADQAKELFQPFTQVDNSPTRRFDGTGLGLAITRSLVELLGGSIHVTSEPNQGSHFMIVLPYAVAPQPPAPVADLANAPV